MIRSQTFITSLLYARNSTSDWDKKMLYKGVEHILEETAKETNGLNIVKLNAMTKVRTG